MDSEQKVIPQATPKHSKKSIDSSAFKQKIHEKIEKSLTQAGWIFQDISYIGYDLREHVAVRRFLLKDGTTADYILFINGKACAAILINEDETEPKNLYGYNGYFPDYINLWYFPLPFVYQVCGSKIYFSNALSIHGEARSISKMHTAEQLIYLLTQDIDAEQEKARKEALLKKRKADGTNLYIYVPQKYSLKAIDKYVQKLGYVKYYSDCYIYNHKETEAAGLGVILFFETIIGSTLWRKVILRTLPNASFYDLLYQYRTAQLLQEKLSASVQDISGNYIRFSEPPTLTTTENKNLLFKAQLETAYKRFKIATGYLDTFSALHVPDNQTDLPTIQRGLASTNVFMSHFGLHYMHVACNNYFKTLYTILMNIENQNKEVPDLFQSIEQTNLLFERLHKGLNIFKNVYEAEKSALFISKLENILQTTELCMDLKQFNFNYSYYRFQNDVPLIEKVLYLIHKRVYDYYKHEHPLLNGTTLSTPK